MTCILSISHAEPCWCVFWFEQGEPYEKSKKMMFRLAIAVLMVATLAWANNVDRFEVDIPDDDLEGESMMAPHNATEEADMNGEELNALDDQDDDLDEPDAALTRGRRCPEGFGRFGRMCIFLGRTKVSWFDALTICKDVMPKSHLVEIRSRKVQRLLRMLIYKRRLKGEYWVGGTNLTGSRKFRWNTSRTYVDLWLWDRREPDNVNRDEHCTEMRHNGRLNDNDCKAYRMYICARRV